jgi:hypothetical protein
VEGELSRHATLMRAITLYIVAVVRIVGDPSLIILGVYESGPVRIQLATNVVSIGEKVYGKRTVGDFVLSIVDYSIVGMSRRGRRN